MPPITADCRSHAYASGYRVGLTETPAQASTAYTVQWGSGCAGMSAGTTVAMDADKSCGVTLTPM